MKAAQWVLFAMVLGGVVSCVSHGASEEGRRPSIPDEVSLKADRSDLEEARKEIPEERRRENDELAGILQMMNAKSGQEPGTIREKFNKVLRDRRDRFDKIMRKRRDEFSKNEKSARDEFLRKAKSERESYLGSKHSSEERSRFFDSQEDQRRDYFANEQDKRKDFESDMSDQRKSVEDYVREKTDEFNDEMRTYTTEFYDRKKNEALQREMKTKAKEKEKVQNEQPRDVRGADDSNTQDVIPPGPGIPLGAPSGKDH